MHNNTVITIGDSQYFHGILLLAASMRQHGMDEPVIAGIRGFTARQREILSRIPGMTLFPLDHTAHSLTCIKPIVCLQADTDYITWVDSDGFFTGNCSALLTPPDARHIHIRQRSPQENPTAFRHCTYGEDGSAIPAAICDAWRRDTGGSGEARLRQSCSACFFSLHRSARPFLQRWYEQMMLILPASNVGVVDRRLKYYHQLDESVLNSLLCFAPEAPAVTSGYRLDKDPASLFVHFVGTPKPWHGWTPRTIRFFAQYTAAMEYAVAENWLRRDEVPAALDARHYQRCRLLAPFVSLKSRLCNRCKRLFA